jgi:hypothetical protein
MSLKQTFKCEDTTQIAPEKLEAFRTTGKYNTAGPPKGSRRFEPLEDTTQLAPQKIKIKNKK